MKIFSKKAQSESLHTLDEAEIQKRLYGRYHREHALEAANFDRKRANPVSPHLEIPNISRSFSPFKDLTSVLGRVRSSFFALWQKFPWKFVAIVTGSLIATVLLFEVLSLWLSRPKVVSQKSPGAIARNVVYRPASSLSAVDKPIIKPEPARVTPPTPVSPTSRTSEAETLKKKYYAVQVCTYQRESDAEQLTRDLNSLNFPAFYLRIPSSQQRIPHYVVFLDREETYAEANQKLSEFRKTARFQDFPDSFIRSL